jgi:MFS family permease
VLIQEIVIAFQLYQITKNPLMLGLVGLMDFIPFLVLSLWGGYIADRFNRQRILQLSFSLAIPLSIALWICFDLFEHDHINANILLISTFGILFLFGCIRGIYSPCFNSLRPFIVPEHLYAHAATWTSMCWQVCSILAPVIGGLMLAHLRLSVVFSVITSIFLIGSLALWALTSRTFPEMQSESALLSIKEAFLYIRKTKIIFWAMFLDLSSVFFGGVIALLPIFASDILHVGATGFGILRSAPAFGALLTMLILVRYPPKYQPWKIMLLSLTGFSLCTLLFAVTRYYFLSVVFLIIIGSCDSVNIIIRQTLLQLIPPRDMLGRIAAINGIFVTSSNELGALHSTLMTRFLTVVPAVLIGGSLSLACVVLAKFKTKDLMRFHF